MSTWKVAFFVEWFAKDEVECSVDEAAGYLARAGDNLEEAMDDFRRDRTNAWLHSVGMPAMKKHGKAGVA